MTDNPIMQKERSERSSALCRATAEKLLNTKSEIRLRLREYRHNNGLMDAVDIPLVDERALRAFLIKHMDEQAKKFDREANRLRFEAISWTEQQAEKMLEEIAKFNLENMK